MNIMLRFILFTTVFTSTFPCMAEGIPFLDACRYVKYTELDTPCEDEMFPSSIIVYLDLEKKNEFLHFEIVKTDKIQDLFYVSKEYVSISKYVELLKKVNPFIYDEEYVNAFVKMYEMEMVSVTDGDVICSTYLLNKSNPFIVFTSAYAVTFEEMCAKILKIPLAFMRRDQYEKYFKSKCVGYRSAGRVRNLKPVVENMKRLMELDYTKYNVAQGVQVLMLDDVCDRDFKYVVLDSEKKGGG